MEKDEQDRPVSSLPFAQYPPFVHKLPEERKLYDTLHKIYMKYSPTWDEKSRQAWPLMVERASLAPTTIEKVTNHVITRHMTECNITWAHVVALRVIFGERLLKSKKTILAISSKFPSATFKTFAFSEDYLRPINMGSAAYQQSIDPCDNCGDNTPCSVPSHGREAIIKEEDGTVVVETELHTGPDDAAHPSSIKRKRTSSNPLRNGSRTKARRISSQDRSGPSRLRSDRSRTSLGTSDGLDRTPIRIEDSGMVQLSAPEFSSNNEAVRDNCESCSSLQSLIINQADQIKMLQDTQDKMKEFLQKSGSWMKGVHQRLQQAPASRVSADTPPETDTSKPAKQKSKTSSKNGLDRGANAEQPQRNGVAKSVRKGKKNVAPAHEVKKEVSGKNKNVLEWLGGLQTKKRSE